MREAIKLNGPRRHQPLHESHKGADRHAASIPRWAQIRVGRFRKRRHYRAFADAQARLNDPNASEFERQAAQAVIKAHSEDIARSPLNQEKDHNTGENLDDIEKSPNFAPRNTGILNIQQHE